MEVLTQAREEATLTRLGVEPCDTRAGPLLLYGGRLQVPAARRELKYRYRLVKSGYFGTGKATDEWLIKSGST